MTRLLQLQKCGQSYWLETQTRAMIRSGELQRRINHEGLRGITANPTTFGVALATGDYDEDIKRLAREGYETDEIYEKLLVRDVQEACDLLQEVHRSSGTERTRPRRFRSFPAPGTRSRRHDA